MNQTFGSEDMKRTAQRSGAGDSGDIKEQAVAFGNNMKDKASAATDSAVAMAKDQVDRLSSSARDIAAETGEKVSEAVQQQKSAGADYIAGIAQATQRAAGEFESQIPQAAQYIRQAAEQLQTVASAVRERDPKQLIGEVETFARRQPALFFGGALLLGFAALRFWKSASDASGSPHFSPGHSQPRGA